MYVNKFNSYNNQSFGKIGNIENLDKLGMTKLEKGIVLKNLKALNTISQDVYADINLGICEAGRYFKIAVSDLERKGDSYVANPRTIFSENSPPENIERALFNSINRATEAYVRHNPK